MTADVNVTEKVARAREFWWAAHLMGKRSHRNARRSSFDAGFDAALAALSDPEVLDGMAGVLAEHQHDVTSYDAWDLHGCDCGWEVPDRDADDAWGLYRAHVAATLADWLRGQES